MQLEEEVTEPQATASTGGRVQFGPPDGSNDQLVPENIHDVVSSCVQEGIHSRSAGRFRTGH